MENKLLTYLMALFAVGFTACTKTYSPPEYKTWIESEETGLNKKKTVGVMEYEMQFQTPEYLLLLNKGPAAFEQGIDVKAELEAFKGDAQFLFTIRNLDGIPPLEYNVTNEMEYHARIQYLSTKVSNDFFLLTEQGDTAKCLFAHHERDFGISPEMRINLAFDLNDPAGETRFCFNDHLFNNGMIRFTIAAEALNNLPELSTK